MHSSSGIVAQVGDPLRPGDRGNIVTLRQQPRERKLDRRAPLTRGDRFYQIGNTLVYGHSLCLKSGKRDAEIALVKADSILKSHREETTAKR